MLKVASDGTHRQIDCCSAPLPLHPFQHAVTLCYINDGSSGDSGDNGNSSNNDDATTVATSNGNEATMMKRRCDGDGDGNSSINDNNDGDGNSNATTMTRS